MAVSIPIQAVNDAKAADSEFWEVLLSIAGPESTWRANATGDCKLAWGGAIVPCTVDNSFPTSFGYTQFHTDRNGLGYGIAPEVLLDGVTNFRLAARHIRGELSAGKTLWEALSPWSTRAQSWALYDRIRNEGIVGVSNGGNGNGGDRGSNILTIPVVTILLILAVVS